MTRMTEHARRNTDQQIMKRKTLAPEKIPPFQIRFPTGDVACKYEVYTSKRNLFMERGFTCSESNQLELPDTVARVIKAHKWESFCQNPSPASIPLVREFYANYDPDNPDSVHVRGKLVDASASAINSLYFLTDHQSSFFEAGSKVSPPAMRDIVEELTGKRVTSKRAKHMYIPWGDLKAGHDIWIKFIKSNLLPTHFSTAISTDRAILLYCIMVGKPINVGKVIAQQIRKCASLKSGDLWFPSLITRLCERHYVLPSSCEPVQQPYPLLLDELVESKSDQQTYPSNKKTSLSDHNPSFPVPSTSHHNAPSLFGSSCWSPLPTPQATSSQPLPPVVPSAPSAEPSSPPKYDYDEVTFPLPTTPTTSSQEVPLVTPSARAAEPFSPPQTDSNEIPIGLNTAKTKERAWINTENQKKKQKTTTQGSISKGNPQPLKGILPLRFRFPADDAVKPYEGSTIARNLFMERGFTCSESNQLELPDTITRVIKAHKWETFCQNPSPASIPLVREFYANYDAARPDLVHVRGKLVDASPSAINSIFSLPNHQSTLFDDVYNVSPLAMRDIVDELTRRKVIYYNMPFYQYELKEGPKIWLSFTKHNLFPCWDSFVGKELAILLYCIMVGKPINVGKVIAKQIRKCAGLTSGALWFPALITRLCEQHNVLASFGEPTQQPYSPLPAGFVEQRVNLKPVESKHDQQTNLSNHQTSHSDHDTSFPVANTGHQSRDEFGSGPNLPIPAEATENAPPHFDSYKQSPPPTAQATSSQPLPPVAPLAPPVKLSCLPQTESDKLPAYFQIHVPGLPILAEAGENAPPHFDSSQQSPSPTAQATSSQSLPPVAPSVLPAEPLSPPQTDSVKLQIGLNTAKTKERDWINTESKHDQQTNLSNQQTNLSNQQTSHSDHDTSFPVANTGHQSRDEFGSGPNLPIPAEATENAPPHFDSHKQSPPPTAQATSSQPLPPVAPLAPPAELSCLPQTESDKLPIHVPGLPILAEAGENAPPHFDSSQQSPPPTAQATSSQSLPPVAPSVLPAKPLSLPQTDSVELQVSSPQCTICVKGYNVKRSVAPVLEAIFKKHGDIAAECQFKTASARSYFLEVVCEVVTRIETDDVIKKMEEIECQVSDAEAAKINVSWLRAHLEAVHKREAAMKKSDLLMETKVNTSLVKRAAHMDLRERCVELMTAQERFEKAERCARVLHLVEQNIKNTILETKAEIDLWVKRRVL